MKESKRFELLFLLKSLLNATNELIHKSEKREEEINSMSSNMNELFVQSEKMFKITFSKEDYYNLYNKYCDEDDRQNK